MTTAQLHYDPFDSTIQDDPYPVYRRLRNEVPVFRAETSNTWVLSRHEDVIAALHDHQTFSSVNGVFPTPPDVPMLESLLPMMIMMDPPRHDQLRGLVSKAFTPRRIAALEAGIDELAASLTEALISSERDTDFIADFAAILPAMVIADLLRYHARIVSSFDCGRTP